MPSGNSDSASAWNTTLPAIKLRPYLAAQLAQEADESQRPLSTIIEVALIVFLRDMEPQQRDEMIREEMRYERPKKRTSRRRRPVAALKPILGDSFQA